MTVNFIKTKFMVINTDKRFHINVEGNVTIKQIRKYLGIILNDTNINSEDIICKFCKGMQIIYA